MADGKQDDLAELPARVRDLIIREFQLYPRDIRISFHNGGEEMRLLFPLPGYPRRRRQGDQK